MNRIHTFTTARGDDPILLFLKELNDTGRAAHATRIIRTVDAFRDQGFHLPDDKLRKVRGELWELRITAGRNPYRILLYHFGEGTFVLLHIFHKKDDAIPESDIVKAEKRLTDDRKRRT
jgi:phage-related protein